jgi:hypothetical protein
MRVAPSQHAGAPDPAGGGDVAFGRYELGGVALYSPSGLVLTVCEEFAGALELSPDAFDAALRCFWVASDPDSPGEGRLSAGTYGASDTEFTLDYTCPEGLTESFQYSADSSSLRMFAASDDGVVLEYTWLLQ